MGGSMTLDEHYELWMFDKFIGTYDKNKIIEMCEFSEYLEEFLEDITG
jgi:hypothetical protein